mmetsp:Transcript_118324/g.379262  ORF Transcript_118324/g.379262 Transcript_118324/m.379262 type:complete len:280 (+) Transcript_118324:435-1274(+)
MSRGRQGHRPICAELCILHAANRWLRQEGITLGQGSTPTREGRPVADFRAAAAAARARRRRARCIVAAGRAATAGGWRRPPRVALAGDANACRRMTHSDWHGDAGGAGGTGGRVAFAVHTSPYASRPAWVLGPTLRPPRPRVAAGSGRVLHAGDPGGCCKHLVGRAASQCQRCRHSRQRQQGLVRIVVLARGATATAAGANARRGKPAPRSARRGRHAARDVAQRERSGPGRGDASSDRPLTPRREWLCRRRGLSDRLRRRGLRRRLLRRRLRGLLARR